MKKQIITPEYKETKAPLRRRALTAIGLTLWVLTSFVLASVIVSLILQMLVMTHLITAGSVNASIVNTVVAALVYSLSLAIAIGVPIMWRDIRTTKEELGLIRLPSWTDIALAPAGFIVYMFSAGILLLLVSWLVPSFNADEVQDVGFDGISRYYEYVLAFITLVVLAPIAEEVLMRGYLYGKLRKVVPVAAAMIISSLLFALMHLQWNVAINVFPLAIVLVILRETTGSIWAGILLHMLKNGVAFYFLFVNPVFLDTIIK